MLRVLRRNFPLRIALLAAGLQALILLVVLGGAYVSAAAAVGRAIDDSLVRYGRAARGGEPPEGIHPEPEYEAAARRSGAVFRTLVEVPAAHEDDEEDHERRGHLEHFVPAGRPEWLQVLWPSDDAVRVAYVALPDGQVRMVAAPAGALAQEMAKVVRGLGAVAAGAIPLAAGLVFWVAHRAFAPLREMAETAAAIGPASLDTRIRPRTAGEDETVDRLVSVLNGMLDRLQAGFRAQARFADDAAHELRTPLGALRTELEVALRHPRDAGEYRRAIASALEEVERLSHLADDLLLLARHERGAVLPYRPDVRLAALLSRAHRELSDLADEAGVAIVTEVPEDLSLDCDPIALERVLANLVRNAIEHSPAGGVVRVSASSRPDPATGPGGRPGVAIHVADEGSGIAPEDLPHIFERFYRADPARRRGGGTGLGLAIARAVVEAHGGRIEAESQPDRGTCLRVWLPRHQPGLGGGQGSSEATGVQ